MGEWLDILYIGETQHARGGKQMFTRKDNENKKYFLPLIIKEQLFEHIKKEHVGLKDLRGWRLIRPFTGLVKTVPRSKHEEPPIFMKDSSDQKSCGTSTPGHKKRVNRAFGAGTVAHKARKALEYVKRSLQGNAALIKCHAHNGISGMQ